MTRGRAALDALLARPEHIVVVVPHGNLLTLILRSFEPQWSFQTWESLSNLDVDGITVHEDHIKIARTWVPFLSKPQCP
jgi:2,3-bisphosphoglycerate-dependent phosphoglycerate mutase